MPEGPEMRRAADTLEAAVKGKPLTRAWFAFDSLKAFEPSLVGQTVTRIEPVAKRCWLFRFKVFHRDGEKCERCGGRIERTMMSSRPFYWCPHCQR